METLLSITDFRHRIVPELVPTEDTRYVLPLTQSAYYELMHELKVGIEYDIQRKKRLSRIKDGIIEIETIIDRFDKFPISYNQVLLRGSLRYCSNALKKLVSLRISDDPIFGKIESFVNHSKGLLEVCHKNHLTEKSVQDEYPKVSLANLDLQLFEDRFEMIEKDCREKGILPPLQNLVVEEDENE